LDAHSRYGADNDIFFSPSSFFIKNKTGELLLFKAGRQPAFTEMKPSETLPLDFQKHQRSEFEMRGGGHVGMSGLGTDELNEFEGMPSGSEEM